MNEITGYIEMPFHGEKGDSAYDVAVKYGYEGTEEEWVDSLGFIPDKSIGEEKLSDAMVGKLQDYEAFLGTVFEKKTEFEEVAVNEYHAEAEEYVVPYRLVGNSGGYKIKIPKLAKMVTVFDENDTNLWSNESSNYRLSKIDVSGYVGVSMKIYGVANTSPPYSCAFCVDEAGNILERYGTDTNTVYGYKLVDEATYHSVDAIETVIPKGAKYIYISGARFKSGSIITCDAAGKIETFTKTEFISNEVYKAMQSPLWGKKLYVDGDSICYGNGYTGGYGKIIADRYNMTLVNNATGGAYITNNAYYQDVSHDKLDWENNDVYYLRLSYYDIVTEKYVSTITLPLTEAIYNKGFGEYLEVYRMVNGVLVRDENDYSKSMPTGKWYVRLEVPTYEGNTVDKYLAMWGYPNADGSYNTPETTGTRWLWEAYNSGFTAAHQNGYCRIGTARHWLSNSVENVETDADYVIFEGGINDYLGNRPIGTLTEDMTSAVDTTTVMGAMERICRYLLKNCIGKKILFVITHKALNYAYTGNSDAVNNATLTDYHDAILAVLKKYSIPVVDLFNNSAFNTELEGYLAYTRSNDGVHPTKESYELFYVPKIVSVMESI